MSFQPYNRNAKSLVYFGDAGADAVFQSDSDLKFDDSTNKLIIPSNGYIGSVGDDDAIQISAAGDVTLGQDLVVQGDFTVNGTTITVNTTNLAVTDSLIELSQGATSAINDAGFIIERGSTGDNAAFIWDESADRFTLGTTTSTGSSTGDLSVTVGTLAANIVGNVTGNVTGTVSGNAGTATKWATARTITLGDELSGSVSIDGSANVTLNASLTAAAITGLTDLAGAPDATNDFIMIYDASATALKKVNRSNFVSGLGAMSNFTLAGDSGSSQTISDGNTLTIAGGAGIDTTAGATDTVTVAVDFTAVQAYDAGLASIAGLTTAANKMIYTTASDTYAVTDLSAFGRSLIDDASAAAARTTLGVDAAGTDNSTNVSLAGSLDYITIVGQVITRNAINLTTDVTGALPVANGGTGSTTAAGARSALNVDVAGTDNSTDVTLNAAVTDVLSLSGQEISAVDNDADAVVGWDDSAGTLTYLSAADARAAIGVDAAGTDNSTDVTLAGSLDYLTISGQVITRNAINLGTDVTSTLPVANGGTGSTTAAGARTSLGLVIGTNVQAYSAILADLAGLTQATNALPYFDSATTAATTTLSAFGRSLIDDADASAARSTLGVDAAGTDNSTNVTLAGSLDYLTISGQVITRNAIALTTDVSGTLPVANGGTGATSLDDIVSASNKLTVANGTATVIGGDVTLTVVEGNIVHDNLSGFVANEHIDHSTVSITAGTGLSGGGTIAATRTISIATGGVDTTQLATGAVTEVKRERSVGTASSTSTISNDITLGTSGAGGITLTLPTAVSGKVVIVKKVDSGAGALTISGPTNGIDGATTKALYHQYETMTFVSNGSVWYVI